MNPNWQRANIQAAATYLREVIAKTPTEARARVVYEGLLDVLDPSRRTARLQRERAASAAAAIPVSAARERRATHERRGTERRKANQGSPTGVERRRGERRTGRERRGSSR